ncbi:MAG: peptidase M24, partial [Desulfovibrionaceae bacterium]|nr:peptidase M24 [Desulfovibrionaceae bacterium]
MLFRKYHIVVFKEGRSDCRNLRFRGWLGAGLCLLVLALAGGNIYLFKYFAKSQALENRLAQTEKLVEEQNAQLINLTG